MKYNTEKFKGVAVALNSLYDENNELNIEATKALVQKYKELGVNGMQVVQLVKVSFSQLKKESS